jgi:hypothetical protein
MKQHASLSQQVRDTFVWRGRFIAPSPYPQADDPAQPSAGYRGHDATVTPHQSPGRRMADPAANWQPCHACGQHIPVREHWRPGGPGQDNFISAISYVCPYCHATQLGGDRMAFTDTSCHVCDTPLGASPACPRCGMLRSWAVFPCSYCPAEQAVCAPHFEDRCNAHILECVAGADAILIKLPSAEIPVG